MTFTNCLDFCLSKYALVGTKTSTDNVIARIIPAPTDEKVFPDFMDVFTRTSSPQNAAFLSGGTNFEPLIILKSDVILAKTDAPVMPAHKWLFDEYSDLRKK